MGDGAGEREPCERWPDIVWVQRCCECVSTIAVLVSPLSPLPRPGASIIHPSAERVSATKRRLSLNHRGLLADARVRLHTPFGDALLTKYM